MTVVSNELHESITYISVFVGITIIPTFVTFFKTRIEIYFRRIFLQLDFRQNFRKRTLLFAVQTTLSFFAASFATLDFTTHACLLSSWIKNVLKHMLLFEMYSMYSSANCASFLLITDALKNKLYIGENCK